MKKDDISWMRHAIDLARKAQELGEVPVGAVLIKHNQIIGEGWNNPIEKNDPSAHAEIQALRSAAQRQKNYRLPGSVLYVTLEPCVMCAGAIFHARLERVVFGTFDPKSGAAGSVLNLFDISKLNHHTQVTGGVLEKDCSELLVNFFSERRKV
jgi:tRNA(adenine34) deaminase